MKLLPRLKKYIQRFLLVAVTVALIASGSLLQTTTLTVNADVNVLVVSSTAIPFGTVFPGEILDSTYTVQLGAQAQASTYTTVLESVPGASNLCPSLAVTNIDTPAEPDTLARATLTRPGDTEDRWQVRLTVPDLQGRLRPDQTGGVVVTAGNYACKISVTAENLIRPELQLRKSGVYDPFTGKISYAIDWSVRGSGSVRDLTITDPVPDQTAFAGADFGGTYATGTVTWLLGDKAAPSAGTVHLTLDAAFHSFFDAVLDYQPGASNANTIRVLDATTNSPVPPDLEGAAFPVLRVRDLQAPDGHFLDTPFTGDFGAGIETKMVDDAAQTFIALGDGGRITVGASSPAGPRLFNGPGVDLILYETPGVRDPACVAVTAEDNTVYPLVPSPACEGKRAFKFQDTGPATGIGVPINLDSLGVPSGGEIKSVTIYDLRDGNALGSTGSPGYDLDAVGIRSPGPCQIKNTLTITGRAGAETLTARADTATVINQPACAGAGGVASVFSSSASGGHGGQREDTHPSSPAGSGSGDNGSGTGSSNRPTDELPSPSNNQTHNTDSRSNESKGALGQVAGISDTPPAGVVTQLPRTGAPIQSILLLVAILFLFFAWRNWALKF